MVENLDRTSRITGEDQLSALNIDIAVSEICVGKRSYEPVDVSDVSTHPLVDFAGSLCQDVHSTASRLPCWGRPRL